MTQRCGTCEFYGALPPIRKDHVYPCNYVVPVPTLPDSVTEDYSFRRRAKVFPKVQMSPDDGTTCPCYKPKKKT